MQTPNSPEKDELEAVRLSEFDRTIGIAGEVMFIDTKKRVTLSNSSPNNMINHYVNGDGVWLFDQEGRKYLDCCNNSASVGHHHPAINKAMYEQAHRHIAHQHYLNESAAIYAENLANNLPEQLETFFFSISETEARELAISIATSVTQKTGIIVIERDICKNLDFKSTTPLKILAVEPHNRYHTSTTHSVGATERHVTMIDKAIGTLNDEGSGVAAFFCDAIFTSDGYLELPTNYFQQAYASIRRVGGLCIADEVRAGLGRTGKMWGFEQYNVVPDIVVVGQLNESGLPIGIVVTTAAIAEKFEQRGGYVRKFVNNSISAAIGNATLEVILSQRAIENVQIVSRYLRGELDFFSILNSFQNTTQKLQQAKRLQTWLP
jgi:4-aminobutyrate aminotransferase-like enzyme